MVAGPTIPSTSPLVLAIARAVRERRGRLLVVGGRYRDFALGIDTKDFDLEVYGLRLEELTETLAAFGEVIAVGRAFGVLRLKGEEIDVSLPRRDSKVGPGHRGFVVDLDPELDYATASRRRDLTVNAIAFDPLTGEILDPHGGLDDLAAGRLRATDVHHFSEDPLRGLRVAQFLARFEMTPDPELRKLCGQLDLTELPGERLLAELAKLMLQARLPSLGWRFLRETALLRFLPHLETLVDVPQDPEWHPEGDVWRHTLMVVDQAAGLRSGDAEEDLALMFGALCHDLGKPLTTEIGDDGRIRSPGHSEAGLEPTRELLERLRASGDLQRQVAALVLHHLAPGTLPPGGAKARAYRRLARRLDQAEVSEDLLYRLARADHLGRETPEALARRFPEGDVFLEEMRAVRAETTTGRDVVLGRHLIARGMEPGPSFGKILAACRDLQDETGWEDPDRILDRVEESGRLGEIEARYLGD